MVPRQTRARGTVQLEGGPLHGQRLKVPYLSRVLRHPDDTGRYVHAGWSTGSPDHIFRWEPRAQTCPDLTLRWPGGADQGYVPGDGPSGVGLYVYSYREGALIWTDPEPYSDDQGHVHLDADGLRRVAALCIAQADRLDARKEQT